MTEIRLLEPWCDSLAGSACGVMPSDDPAGRLSLLGSVADVAGCGVDGRAVGAATVPGSEPVVLGRAVGTLPSGWWSAMVGRPGWEAWLGGVCGLRLGEPVRSVEPVWLVGLGWLIAGDELVGWLGAVAWPGMAACPAPGWAWVRSTVAGRLAVEGRPSECAGEAWVRCFAWVVACAGGGASISPKASWAWPGGSAGPRGVCAPGMAAETSAPAAAASAAVVLVG